LIAPRNDQKTNNERDLPFPFREFAGAGVSPGVLGSRSPFIFCFFCNKKKHVRETELPAAPFGNAKALAAA